MQSLPNFIHKTMPNLDEICFRSVVMVVILVDDKQINRLVDKLWSYHIEHLYRKPNSHNITHCVDSPFRSNLIKCRYISDNWNCYARWYYLGQCKSILHHLLRTHIYYVHNMIYDVPLFMLWFGKEWKLQRDSAQK